MPAHSSNVICGERSSRTGTRKRQLPRHSKIIDFCYPLCEMGRRRPRRPYSISLFLAQTKFCLQVGQSNAIVSRVLSYSYPSRGELSFQGGALDLADEREITPDNVSQREYHHLFPVAYLKEKGKGEDAFNALNCALVTWRTNRAIAAKEPVKYLLERVEAAALGSEALRNRLRSHAIPYEPMADGDYDAFLSSRAEMLEAGIGALCSGEPWRPPGPE